MHEFFENKYLWNAPFLTNDSSTFQKFPAPFYELNYCVHGKNGFAEVSKNLANTDLKILLYHQNNYVELLNVDADKATKSFNILTINVWMCHTIIFRSVSIVLNILVKPFFACIYAHFIHLL